MPLDIPTLYAVMLLLAVLMALWVCFMAWGQDSSNPLWAWAQGLGTFDVALLMYGLTGVLPGPVISVVNVVAGAGTFALMLLAVRRFYGLSGPGLWVWAPLLVNPASALMFSEHVYLRSLSINLMYVLQITLILRVLLDPKLEHSGRGRYMLLFGFCAQQLVLIVRVCMVLAGATPAFSGALSNGFVALLFVATLVTVLGNTLGFAYMIMERSERRNFELAMKDMLTGLSNRRAITDVLLTAVARAQRQGQLLSVLMLDIDHFKKINDSYGHQAGDKVLQGVAQILQSRLRAQDQIGRFGGEEFLVVLPDTGIEGALTLAEALRAAVESTPTQWGVHRISATISIGVRGGMVTGADTADGLVGAADAAMYRAKQTGRNRIEY
ncbi:GGDEF domain-containing protein [Roseateles koreensis]|uniref:diguanylate cyclase n=1 Tax=Roseateles koreensis TaxID=2987526 RepID=A0ABT5KSL6_9BURK|nr:GGDEF domain-containing protein [Roseateles koreensis]MDC8785410.1 GGDEF domain-containing protein [Roseateles koreensis]